MTGACAEATPGSVLVSELEKYFHFQPLQSYANIASMTTAELIEQLKEFPQDLPVCVTGYEGGVDDKFTVKLTSVLWDEYKIGYDYFGDHEEIAYRVEDYPQAVPVVLLERS